MKYEYLVSGVRQFLHCKCRQLLGACQIDVPKSSGFNRGSAMLKIIPIPVQNCGTAKHIARGTVSL